MAITYPLTFPTHKGRQSIVLRQINAVAVSASPFTFEQQIHAHAGQRWEADVVLPPMIEADAKQWIGWLSSLKGRKGTFTMGDTTGASPRGVGGGTPLVFGGGQVGDTLNIDGGPISQVGWLLAGDYIQLGSGSSATLHMVLTDTDTDGSGLATLDLWPSIRNAPTDNSPVVISNTVGRWRLVSNEMAWSVSKATIYGISFTCVEAI